ncbi:unnamed protein product, partial [Rotaria magnacalcarata]
MDKTTAKFNGVNISGTYVNNLRFADDIDLINENHSILQKHLEQITKTAEEAGLLINIQKTKTL